MESKIPYRNRNHTGWWIYSEVQQWIPKHRKRSSGSRYSVYENLRIIRAKNRDTAFRKAMKLSMEGMPSETIGGEWRFVGISLLLPVYEGIEDGAEILWTDRGSMLVKNIKKLVKSRHQLPVFNDKSKA